MFKTQKYLTQHSDIVQIKEKNMVIQRITRSLNLVVRQQLESFFARTTT